MTTIVYRDGIMAADSWMHSGRDARRPDRVRKIIRLPHGGLFAGAGDAGIFNALERWCREANFEANPDMQQPPPPEIPECDAWWVQPDGAWWYFTGKGYRLVDAPFGAIGSGTEAALAACYMGASAEEAVRIACLIDPFSGGGIQVQKL
jgi:hypothetical protein